MYFPTSSAKRLSLSTGSTPDLGGLIANASVGFQGDGGQQQSGLGDVAKRMERNREGTRFVVLNRDEFGLWSTRPPVLVAKLKRSPSSLRQYGTNVDICWTWDDTGVVVLTSKGHLLPYSILSYYPSSSTISSSTNISDGEPIYKLPTTSGKSGAAGIGQFSAGPGEGQSLGSVVVKGLREVRTQKGAEIGWLASTPTHILYTTSAPETLHAIPWSKVFPNNSDTKEQGIPEKSARSAAESDRADGGEESEELGNWDWLGDRNVTVTHISACPYSETTNRFTSLFITSDGSCSIVGDTWANGDDPREPSSPEKEASLHVKDARSRPRWKGRSFYPTLSASPSAGSGPPNGKKAINSTFNSRFSLVAIGLEDGTLQVFSLPSQTDGFLPVFSHSLSLRDALNSTSSELETGKVTSLNWTSDGYALAVAWERGWSVWSVYGRLNCWAVGGSAAAADGGVGEKFEDHFMKGVKDLFWNHGDLELFVLCPVPLKPKYQDEQLFIVPFAKSAVAGLHSPDNTQNAFLQLDDRLLAYRGADQPDMSVINPESDVWQHIKVPSQYITSNWPIRYVCSSSDGRLLAVAGRRGLTHYNANSGRWKLFESESQEQGFTVRGGMQWFGNVLIAATEENGTYQIRLFARDKPLNISYALHFEELPSPVVLISMFDNSLLVYTEDNTFYHFLAVPTKDGTRLRLCGSIGFEGVVREPKKVRGMSWLIPRSQQRFGDPADDLNVATIIFLIDGKLLLLRPRRAVRQEVKYDMQMLADKIEFYWTHLSGIGTLENSLWGWDGKRIRVWLNALTIETIKVDPHRDAYEYVEESLAIGLDFYPLSVLMDKGIIVGIDHETSLRKSLDFAIFRIITNTHLFLHHVLRYHLTKSQMKEAVLFASHYQHLVYFAHALEILLHAVLEDEADARHDLEPVRPSIEAGDDKVAVNGGVKKEGSEREGAGDERASEREAEVEDADSSVLARVVDFLDHFDEALQVVVGCARKTEVARWSYLFGVVGKPRDLFEECMLAGSLKVAASYLLVLHNLEPLEQSSKDTIRLLKAAMEARDWVLCKELLRFLYSLDHSGLILRTALHEAGALPPGYDPPPKPQPPGMTRSVSAPILESNGSSPSTSNGGDGEDEGDVTITGSAMSNHLAKNPAVVTSGPTSSISRSPSMPVGFQRAHSSSTASGPNASLHAPSPSLFGMGLGALLARVGMGGSPMGQESRPIGFERFVGGQREGVNGLGVDGGGGGGGGGFGGDEAED